MSSDRPESAEDYYARIEAVLDGERRLAVAVDDMPGWDIFPFELDSLRIKPLEPLADEEAPRRGETAADCWCTREADPAVAARTVWSNERWVLHLNTDMRLPISLSLGPRAHHDLNDLDDDLASEMGRLTVAISRAIEELPSVGRSQVAKYGDGGAHLHLFFFGRPARILQMRGSPLLDWEENLPAVPPEVLQANATFVARHVVASVGGEGPAWLES
jgi:diadenosine tetraphosphate (Ap4A) HIT family hydrolase